MPSSTEQTITNCAFITIGTTAARDLFPQDKGGTGEGFVPQHILGGMVTFTLLLLAAGPAPELAKAFAILIATIMFLYSGASMLQEMFSQKQQKGKRAR